MSESGCGHAVINCLHLCMWAQYNVAYGKPALNEDSSTYIMPRSLKKGCKLIDKNKLSNFVDWK